MSKKSDEPAFPTENTVDGQRGFSPMSGGLTKREYFAACAMQGLLAGLGIVEEAGDLKGLVMPKEAAQVSVNYADALLAELSKTEGKE